MPSDSPKTRRSGGPSTKTSSRFRGQSLRDPVPDQDSPPRIVGIGASAGGLEAFTRLLAALPAQTGLAFVFIEHQSPKEKSALTEILTRATGMTVCKIDGHLAVSPDHVYVLPPRMDLGIFHGILTPMPHRASLEHHTPIDYFLTSLAQDRGDEAIGVLLSGTGTDGSAGLKEIKARGGTTMVQEPGSALFGGMPSQAIAAGAADRILSLEEIAREIGRLGRFGPGAALENVDGSLREIFLLLRQTTGADFSLYKPTTIRRRISRRLALHGLRALEEYVECLRDNPRELDALYRDILINVTSFFRDPEIFDCLKKEVFPKLVASAAGGAIRLWVPGCATGEEAYSLAISLVEYLQEAAVALPVQVFATDINETALERARAGTYPESIDRNITRERLDSFFTMTKGEYRVNKALRAMCVFAKQNLIQDPPISKIDLISCRNVLIYLGSTVQKKIIPIFHFALKPAGYLVLGGAESIGPLADLFASVHKKCRIYVKKDVPPAALVRGVWSLSAKEAPDGQEMKEIIGKPRLKSPLEEEVDRLIMAKYAPACVVIDADLKIILFRGQTGAFLEPGEGVASLHLYRMVRSGLLPGLRAVIREAKETNHAASRDEFLIHDEKGVASLIRIEVTPLAESQPENRFLLVSFAAKPTALAGEDAAAASDRQTLNEEQIEQLQGELSSSVEYHQALLAQRETANEELRAANEEILSSNEELQSTQEEMEMAREELQAANEELITINEELRTRNVELNRANDDVINLINSVDAAIVIINADSRIRRFTAAAQQLLNVLPSDIGRPIGEVKLSLPIPNVEAAIKGVIETLVQKELAVQDRQGRWFSLRIRPYKTADNKIDGVLLVAAEVEAIAEGEARQEEA